MEGERACHRCSAAKFANLSGTINCVTCQLGKESLSTGAVECQPCAAGLASNTIGLACSECDAGRYRTTEANGGKFCDLCEAGKEVLGSGAVKCLDCGAGYYNNEKGVVCAKCKPGDFRNATANGGLACSRCQAGYSQHEEGQASCLPCVPGTFQKEQGQASCVECAKGKFAEEIASTICEIPGVGSVAGPSGAGRLSIAPGWVASKCRAEGNQKVCEASEPCLAGTFGKDNGCSQCPAGFTSSSGETRCSECVKGQYTSRQGQAPCNFCASDSYAKKEGSTKCALCPSGYAGASSFCIEASTDKNLPSPENVQVMNVILPPAREENGENTISANVSWTIDSQLRVQTFEIQWSKSSKFTRGDTTRFKILPVSELSQGFHVLFLGNQTDTFQALWQNVVYLRIRTISAELRHSAWSSIAPAWKVAKDCSKKQFLNTQFGAAQMRLPLSWSCEPCPKGAFCEGNIMYKHVVPLFGWWRVPNSIKSSSPHIFVDCPFPGACLGAPNPLLAHKYFNGTGGIDYALSWLPESCNEDFGFKRDSRLCHTCLRSFRRMGRDRCSTCPTENQNVWLLILAVFLMVLAGIVVVWMAIADAGKATVSEISRKIMFNYLQVSALAAGFPMKWPAPLEALFDFQGAISTAGEHLLNPDCSMRDVKAADLFYYKQFGYAAIPPLLAFFIYLYWRLYACVRGLRWRGRPQAGTTTMKDKMVVTLCVLLYFFWPTLLAQAFRLFSCRTVGGEGTPLYLMADFEEPCFVGRHLWMALIMGIGQILLYAIGLPLIVFIFLSRHKHELDKPVVRFRYGLFFAGFRRERFYWECIVALRKESIVVLSVFGPSMGTSQLAHVALLVILSQTLVQLIGSPYGNDPKHRRLQVLDVASLVVCWTTMWSGYFFHSVEFSSRGKSLEALTIVVIVINVLHMVWLLVNMFQEMCDEKKDTSLVKSIKKRVSFNSAPAPIRLRVKHARMKRQILLEKLAAKEMVNPLESNLESNLAQDTMEANSVEIELPTRGNKKKPVNNSTRKNMVKRKLSKRGRKSALPKLTASQQRRKQSIRQLSQQGSWKTNQIAVNKEDLEADYIRKSIHVDETSGERFLWDPNLQQTIWFEELDQENADTIIHVDEETGKRYLWDYVVAEAIWLDDEVEQEEADTIKLEPLTCSGVNPMHPEQLNDGRRQLSAPMYDEVSGKNYVLDESTGESIWEEDLVM